MLFKTIGDDDQTGLTILQHFGLYSKSDANVAHKTIEVFIRKNLHMFGLVSSFFRSSKKLLPNVSMGRIEILDYLKFNFFTLGCSLFLK